MTPTQAIEAISHAAKAVRTRAVGCSQDTLVLSGLAWAARNAEEKGVDYTAGWLSGVLSATSEFTVSPVLSSALFVASETLKSPDDVPDRFIESTVEAIESYQAR